jgi:ketosteroid isomerase-like protein
MRDATAETVVRAFWARMAANDFVGAGELLADTFVAEWPQTRERIRGRTPYVAINVDYPASGPWVFTLQQVVATATQVVTDVTFTDGVQTARAISFCTVDAGRITHMTEYFPDPYPPPPNRAHLVEPLEP